ncbi:MAG: hypothetical protein C0428_17530 [Polaromonas sp.]|nr:hypothetical protein [Polaromonas sp.]
MSDIQPARSIWQMAAKPLMAGAVMCLAAAAIAGGANWMAQRIAVEQGKAQAALDAANLSLENTQSDRARLEENLQMFGKLRQSRFAHAPERLVMLEALGVAARHLGKTPLLWELGAQQKLMPLNDDKTGEAVAHLVRVPMKLSASGVHEEEWQVLLALLNGSPAGYFTTDSCVYDAKSVVLSGSSGPAVDVRCELSWLYVVAEGTAPKPP